MRDLGKEKLANPLIRRDYRSSLGSASYFNGLAYALPCPMFAQHRWVDMSGFAHL
jgi:hypothetical protein